MEFNTKLKLFIFTAIILPIGIVLTLTFRITGNEIRDTEYNLLKSNVNFVLDRSQSLFNVIKSLDVEKVPFYLAASKKQVFEDIRKIISSDIGILILDTQSNRIIFSNDNKKENTVIDPDTIKNMISKIKGEKELALKSDSGENFKHLAAFDVYDQWNWLIISHADKSTVYSYMYQAMRYSFIVIAFLLVIILFIVSKISNGISKPIEILKKGMVRISENNFEQLVPVNEHDEFGKLAKNFNEMAVQLHNTQKEINFTIEKTNNLNIELENEIKERNQVENELRESESHFRLIFENNPISTRLEDFTGIGNIFKNLQKNGVSDIHTYFQQHPEIVQSCIEAVKIIDVNQACLSIHNTDSKQILIDGLRKILATDLHQVFLQQLEALWNGDLQFIASAMLQTIAGEQREVIIQYNTLPDSEQSFSRVIVSSIDITERKNLEAQLLQSQKMESLGTMAGGIAHEFNNILTVMQGYLELSLKGMSGDDPLKTKIETVYNSGKKATELVQQILLFSRKEITKSQLMDPIPILKQTLKIIRATTPANIELNLNLDNNCGLILANATQFNQVIMNLVNNGIHALYEKDGQLNITARIISHDNSDPIHFNHLKLDESDAVFNLEIEDTGTGIQKESLHHIFDPFFTTKEPGKGTGLGLSVVHSIIENHNGKITVESEVGKGTTFNIYFPSNMDLILPDKTAIQNEIITVRKGRILIVEDQKFIAELYTQFLEDLGYSISVCYDGQDALKLFKEKPQHFDLVLSDMEMPKMTGKQLAIELLKSRPNLPIILSSGYSDAITKDLAKDLGIYKFLTKPIELSVLSKTIDNCLRNNSNK